MESLCSQLVAANCAREAAEAEVKVLRSALETGEMRGENDVWAGFFDCRIEVLQAP